MQNATLFVRFQNHNGSPNHAVDPERSAFRFQWRYPFVRRVMFTLCGRDIQGARIVKHENGDDACARCLSSIKLRGLTQLEFNLEV